MIFESVQKQSYLFLQQKSSSSVVKEKAKQEKPLNTSWQIS